MNKTEICETLQFFNKKVDELGNSSFLKNWESQKILWDSLTSQLPSKFILPNDEETKAFILTLRFFCQNNEPISVANISKIYKSNLIAEELKLKFHFSRKALNTILDLNFRSSNLTNRDILDAFIYGNYAHSTKRDKYLELTKKHHLNFASFYSVTNSFYIFLEQIKEINLSALKNLSAT